MTNASQKSKAETVKENSRGLRGTIQEELEQDSSVFSAANSSLLKFHGIYPQEDRDQRKERSRLHQEKAYQFMVRIKNPGGGRLSFKQWLALDQVADLFGNGSLRLTTRQDIQFHGVGKKNLKSLIRLLTSDLISTYGACGDGVRNTLACPVTSLRADSCFNGLAWAQRISTHFAFRSNAYFEIWLNGEKMSLLEDEPVYGKAYLPRKFKMAIADPKDNCVDVHTNDVGIIPALRNAQLEGFHLVVGGGLGSTHGKKETYPRLATPLGLVTAEQLIPTLETLVKMLRDLGDRQNRKHARLKYLVEEMGPVAIRREVEQRLGCQLAESSEIIFSHAETHLGWHRQKEAGLQYVGLFVENGRIVDGESSRFKTGLREIVRQFHPGILLTPRQDLILCDVPDPFVSELQSALARYGMVPRVDYSALRVRSMACPALPTCGLAITEAERRLPGLISELEERGFGNESVVVRMAGCPNSCSRPPVAEIGLIGKSANGYHVYVGGSAAGTRLASLYQEDVPAEQLAPLLAELFTLYRKHRAPSVSFGDWAHGTGISGLHELAGRSFPPPAPFRIVEGDS